MKRIAYLLLALAACSPDVDEPIDHAAASVGSSAGISTSETASSSVSSGIGSQGGMSAGTGGMAGMGGMASESSSAVVSGAGGMGGMGGSGGIECPATHPSGSVLCVLPGDPPSPECVYLGPDDSGAWCWCCDP